MVNIEGITHWALAVNDLTESEEFYRDLLGLEHKGRLPGGSMSCVAVGANNILLCQRKEPGGQSGDQYSMHMSFTVNPATFEDSVRLLHDRGVTITQLV
jgi:catechol 2,3-dioxygenase-like lactoylglutathione lyase family enzyme